MNGLLPPGRGTLVRGAAGAAGAGAAGAAAAGAAGIAAGTAGAGATGATTSGATGAAGAGAGAAAALAGAALAGAAGAAAACVGKASFNLRTTGASTVEDALLTNSPWSFNHCKSALLSIPNSFASSWTRALPATTLLVSAGLAPDLALVTAQPGYRDMLIGATRSDARSSRTSRSELHQEPLS